MTDLEKLVKEVPSRYCDVEVLGQGGMGVVLRAKDSVLDKVVAIKMLLSSVSEDQIARFQLEAKACGRLKHTNILDVLDFGITETNSPYFVMEYLSGKELTDYIDESESLELDFVLPVSIQIASALSYAHQEGVIHRDIKPSNIVLAEGAGEGGSDEVTVKVIDFGLAKLSKDQHLTQTGVAMGSPLYMSPEQVNGAEVGKASDIYSFGCLVYKMLTGVEPIIGNTALDTMNKKLSQEAPSVSEAVQGKEIPQELEQIVASCLCIDPADRHSSFEKILSELRALEEKILFGTSDPEEAKINFETEKTFVSKFGPGLLLVVSVIVVSFACVLFLVPQSDTKLSVPESYSADGLETGDIASVISDFPAQQETVIARKTKIESATDNSLKIVKGHKEIKELEIENSQISAKGLKDSLTGLELIDIDLTGSNIDDEGLVVVSEIDTLEKVSLNNCLNLTDKGIVHLAKLKNLEVLKLGNTGLADEGAKELSKLKRLSNLDIGYTKVTDKGLSYIANLPKLKELVIGSRDKGAITDLALLAKLKKLRILNLYSFDASFEPLVKLKSIRSLAVKNVDLPDDIGDVLSRMKGLDFLCIKASQHELSKEALKSIGSAKNITKFRLGRVPISRKNLSNYKYLTGIETIEVKKGYTSMDVKDREIKNVLNHAKFM